MTPRPFFLSFFFFVTHMSLAPRFALLVLFLLPHVNSGIVTDPILSEEKLTLLSRIAENFQLLLATSATATWTRPLTSLEEYHHSPR